MKKIFVILLAALPLLVGSCSKDDEENNNGGENEEVITPGNDTRPTWEYPNYNNWEQTMTVRLLMQKELEPYVTDGDLLCAKINDEVRGLTPPEIDGDEKSFPITIGADGAEGRVFLSYYCDSLHRILTIDWADFNANAVPMGDDDFYRPTFWNPKSKK